MLQWINYPLGALVGLALFTFGLVSTGNLEPLDGKGAFVPIFGTIFLLIAGGPAAVLLALLFRWLQPAHRAWRILAAGLVTGSLGVAVAAWSALSFTSHFGLNSMEAIILVASGVLFLCAAVIDLVVCWK